MKPLPKQHLQALIAILADTDALWLPARTYQPQPAAWLAAVAERRVWYRSRGVDLTIGGGASERQAGHRDLQKLASRGFVRLHRGRGHRRGASLTEAGDDYARAITGGYTVRESFPLLERVEAVKAEFDGATAAGFIAEVDLLGRNYDRLVSGDLVDLENRCLPLLARGWLESASDCGGRVGYHVTDEGQAAMAAVAGKLGDLPMPNDEAGALYDELFKASLDERTRWSPSTPNRIAIPLSAGMWPAKPETNRA